METFRSGDVTIAFIDEAPEGGASQPFPVLLIHGFASHTAMNWISTGWVRDLLAAGYRVVSLDNRGHGQSEKLYTPGAYSAAHMAGDALRLLDHLKIVRAHVMGYSMGARVAATLALGHPERVARLVLGGLGYNMVRAMAGTGPIAQAFLADDPGTIASATARTFRTFADQTKSDRKALAVCVREIRDPIPPEKIATLSCPVLVATGSGDVIAGPAAALAQMIPGAQSFEIAGRDHMKAVGDRSFKDAVLRFLDGREPAGEQSERLG